MESSRRLNTRQRILIADEDLVFARRLSDYMWDHGFEARVVKSASEAKMLVEFWSPDTVFIDHAQTDSSAASLFKFINSRRLKKNPKVIVTSKQANPQSIEQMRKAGAAHYLVKPFSLEEAFRAVDTGEAVERRDSKSAATLSQGPSSIKELHLINLFLKQATQGAADESSLYNLMRMINLKVQGLRTSLVRIVNDKTGVVLASNDDERVQGLPLNLQNYPEFTEVKKQRKPLVIPNVRSSDVLAKVKSQITKTPFQTLVLFPVFRYGDFYGVLSVRLEQKEALEIFYIEKFGQVCSQIISLAITNPDQSLVR